MMVLITDAYINGLVQDCSNSIANALELQQSCTNRYYMLHLVSRTAWLIDQLIDFHIVFYSERRTYTTTSHQIVMPWRESLD